MPLRDHFRPPVDEKHAWNELHAMWPAMIVQHLYQFLPEGFIATPSVHLGIHFEIDIGVSEDLDAATVGGTTDGGVATTVAPGPVLTLETELPDEDEFEVRIFNTRFGRELVAAIELVSPSNKDRPESRRAFVGKVAALLREGVSVSIVDLVTVRQFNLYAELLEFLGQTDPHLGPVPPHLYAVTLRNRRPEPRRRRAVLDLWRYPMAVGEPLPTLPIWLEPDRNVLLPLDVAYEETCKLLHIR